jgi:hypothetical protein
LVPFCPGLPQAAILPISASEIVGLQAQGTMLVNVTLYIVKKHKTSKCSIYRKIIRKALKYQLEPEHPCCMILKKSIGLLVINFLISKTFVLLLVEYWAMCSINEYDNALCLLLN